MYEYRPLPGGHYKSMLRLETKERKQPTPTGLLTLRDLDGDGPEYTLLSYSWGRNSDGDDSLNRTILIDGSILPISENLYDFLIEASRPTSAITEALWADAICISQRDVQERGDQVSIMGDIYKKSSKLIIWLGHGASGLEDESVLQLRKFSVSWNVSHKTASRSYIETGELHPETTGLPMSGLQKRALAAAKRLANGHLSNHFGTSGNKTWKQHLYRAVLDNINPFPWLRRVYFSRSLTRMPLPTPVELFGVPFGETLTQYIFRTLRNHVCNWLWLCLVQYALFQSRGPRSIIPLITHLDPLLIHEQLWMSKNSWLIYILGRRFFNDLLAALILLIEAPAKLSQR